MKNTQSTSSLQKAAKVAGLMFLLTMAASAFAEFFVRSRIIIWENPTETVINIKESPQLFHVGMLSDLICFANVTILIIALYVLLKEVHRSIALLALSWRLIETGILGFNVLNSFIVVKILNGADYLNSFEPDQLHTLAYLFLNIHGSGYFIGLLFFSLGSAVFNYLFFKSRYIPRLLSGWGMFASLFLLACTIIILVSPNPPDWIYRISYLPIFIDEIILGFWLLFAPLRMHAGNAISVGTKKPTYTNNSF